MSATSFCLLASCDHKELCYDHSHVTTLDVKFDWAEVTDASPASMSLYLFPRVGGETLRFDFSGNEGGSIRVAPGEYDAICLNSDTYNILLAETHSFSSFEIYTKEGEMLESLSSKFGFRSESIPRAESAKDEPVATQPEQLWVGVMRGITVEGNASTSATRRSSSLSLPMVSLVETYHFTITNIRNINHLEGLGASLSGMAGGALPASASLSDRVVTVPFDVDYRKDTATAEAQIKVFGHCRDGQGNHRLVIYAVMDDGNKYYYDIDVNNHIHNPETPDGQFDIVIDGLELPTPVDEGSGGLSPSVDDWETVDIDINM